ncbi:MAG: hypothetical protein ACI9N9_001244 [Enterobacterales bacterium]
MKTKAFNMKILICTFILFLAIISCSADDSMTTNTVYLGNISLPSLTSSNFIINVDHDENYYITLTATVLKEFLSESLEKCRQNKDPYCLLKEELGELEWSLLLDDKKIIEGNMNNIEFTLHDRIFLAIVELKAQHEYKLSIYKTNTNHQHKNIREFRVDLVSLSKK